MSVSIKTSIIAALKKNLLPGLILQTFVVIILLFYFFVPAAKPVFLWFSLLKQNYGAQYSFFATALFGGIIPFTYLWLTDRLDSGRHPLAILTFDILFWGYRGVEVDYFYRLQGYLFGYNSDLYTIAIKTAFDQFIYSVFWAAPSITIILMWAQHHFSFRDCRNAMNRHFFHVKMPTIILSNWLVWLPAIAIVYSMPKDLQIPLFNLVLCFWVLLLSALNKKDTNIKNKVAIV